MITKVEIENFLSHKKTTVDLGNLTVITGRNLSGKSNIIRAIRWCLLNDGTWSSSHKDSVRRKGSKYTAVTVHFDDGRAVRRYRDKSTNTYTLINPDGTTREIGGKGTSIGRGFPAFLGEFTNITPIKWPDGGSDVLQFQDDTANGRFLLADGPTRKASHLTWVTGTLVIEKAVRKARKAAADGRKLLTAMEYTIEDLEHELLKYSGIDECEHDLDLVRKLDATKDELLAEFSRITTLATTALEAKREINRISNLAAVDVEPTVYKVLNARKLQDEAQRAVALAEVAYRYEALPSIDTAVNLLAVARARSDVATELTNEADTVYNIAAKALGLSNDIESTMAELKGLKHALDDLISSLKTCPVNETWDCPYLKGDTKYEL